MAATAETTARLLDITYYILFASLQLYFRTAVVIPFLQSYCEPICLC